MLIDVHAHQFPQKYIETVTRHGRQLMAPMTGGAIEERLALMDGSGVDMQVLSPANLVPNFENEAVAVEAAKILNDGYAELTHRLPKRFKAYVSLPMPHVDASLREMERGLDQLGFAGVYSGCSILDRPVTEKEFDPVYNEMNRRGSILCFHPVVNGLCSALLNDFNLAGSVGTTLEDTLVVLHMIIRQIPHRYPNIKIIVPHFGGSISTLLNRIDNQVAATYKDLPEKPSVTAKRFWYDTVGHGSYPALRCACEAFGPEHLVTGSDYPVPLMYEGYGKTLQDRHTKAFSYIKEAGLPSEVVEQILHRSAPDLFGVPRG
jgi:predicted TIM-barrel fold metal-dependent hydrolase